MLGQELQRLVRVPWGLRQGMGLGVPWVLKADMARVLKRSVGQEQDQEVEQELEQEQDQGQAEGMDLGTNDLWEIFLNGDRGAETDRAMIRKDDDQVKRMRIVKKGCCRHFSDGRLRILKEGEDDGMPDSRTASYGI